MREQANIPPANNPAGADWRKVLVVLQTSLAAAQQERYLSIKGPQKRQSDRRSPTNDRIRLGRHQNPSQNQCLKTCGCT